MNHAENTIAVRHVSVSLDKTFEEACARFESRMGHRDYPAFNELLERGMSEGAARDYMKSIEGPLGLMIFAVIDHGRLAGLAGKASGAKTIRRWKSSHCAPDDEEGHSSGTLRSASALH